MGKLHRVDQPDTIDAAYRTLAGFQADMWGLSTMTVDILYEQAGHHHRTLPYEAVIVIRLRPADR